MSEAGERNGASRPAFQARRAAPMSAQGEALGTSIKRSPKPRRGDPNHETSFGPPLRGLFLVGLRHPRLASGRPVGPLTAARPNCDDGRLYWQRLAAQNHGLNANAGRLAPFRYLTMASLHQRRRKSSISTRQLDCHSATYFGEAKWPSRTASRSRKTSENS